ncbi:MAG TPA: hypothetical protein VKQ28_11885 [Candidatus Acidoferrum sp.]|nr:hypothetical protein [Candidatus Acidoferrum sp.]
MLLAKLALGFCATVTVAGAYTFHEGVMQVDEDQHDGRRVHVWVPAAIVPMAMRVIPNRHFDHALAQAGPWLPTLRALTKELKRYPEALLVEVKDGSQHVSVRTQNGKLLIDVTEPGEDVHVACPLGMMEDVASELEAKAPGA